jgi:hypothetical protein
VVGLGRSSGATLSPPSVIRPAGTDPGLAIATIAYRLWLSRPILYMSTSDGIGLMARTADSARPAAPRTPTRPPGGGQDGRPGPGRGGFPPVA